MVVRHQRHELKTDVACGNAGDFGVVIGRGNLHDVSADEVHATEAANDLNEFTAGDAASFGRARARCVRRVQDVDVHGNVEGPLANAVADFRHSFQHTPVVHVRRGDDTETEAVVVIKILFAVERATRSHMRDRFGIQDAFLHSPAERGAVRVLGTEVRVPRVQMRIKVQHGDGLASTLGGGAQQWQ